MNVERHMKHQKVMSMTEQPFISYEYKRAFFVDMLGLTDEQIASMIYAEIRNIFRRRNKKLYNVLYEKHPNEIE